MPDRIERLRQTLTELESELRDIDSLDTESRNKLLEVSREINAVLSREETAAVSSTKAAASDFQQRLLEIETAHPTVTGIIQRLIEGLGQMGI